MQDLLNQLLALVAERNALLAELERMIQETKKRSAR